MAVYFLEKVLRECPRVYQLFREAQRVVERMWLLEHHAPPPVVPTCHHVARLVQAHIPDLLVVDGHFKSGYEHSWLTPAEAGYIIDPYPVAAISGPLLIDIGCFLSPWASLYSSSQKPTAITQPGFEEDVGQFIHWFNNTEALPL